MFDIQPSINSDNTILIIDGGTSMNPLENYDTPSLSCLSLLDFHLKSFFCHRLFTLFVILAFILNLILFLMPTPNQKAAQTDYLTATNSAVKKIAKTIRIEPGDSLWSIAKTYYTPECGTLKEYIKEIQICNQLSTETIHAGRYLVVPHYIPNNGSLKE